MTFVIDSILPSLNEYQYACRSHWSSGRAFKAGVESVISVYIKKAVRDGKIHAIERPCEIYIEWHEKTKRRDVDNIQSAQKFILDALQENGIIKNDSRKYVNQIHHTVIDDKSDYVVVELREV